MKLHTILFILLSILISACGNDDSPSQTKKPNVVEPAPRTLEAPTLAVETNQNEEVQQSTPIPTVTTQTDEVVPIIADPRAEQMDKYIDDLTAEGQFMGSVLVAQNGSFLLNDGYGMADIAAVIPNTPDNQYRIGSLTKQFTAAAILRLQEEGLLNVQDPVQMYLPDYPNGDLITIHQLLTHTAGIPNYERRPDLPQVVQSPIALDDLIASFSRLPLEFPPGQNYSYSSSGYVVLTKIIEIVSGQSYADYIQEQILAPAGMNNSGYDYLDPNLPNPAVGYMLTGRGPQKAILTDSSWPTGAGALYSTLGDLYRWDRALYGNDILDQGSVEAMFTPWVDTGQGADYGYGWDIGSTVGRPSIAHGGGIFGFASYMVRFPQDDAVVIVLSNGIQMPPRVVAEGLAQILFNNESP